MAENDDRGAWLMIRPIMPVQMRQSKKKNWPRILHAPMHLRETGYVLHPNGASQPESWRIKHESCSI